MNLKILIIICISASEIEALKRIKRNSLEESKTSRVKQDFMILQNANQNSHIKEDVDKGSFDSSNNKANDSDKKLNVPRPLAIILKEREHKLNENRSKIHDKTQKEYPIKLNTKEVKRDDKSRGEYLDKLFEDNGNSKSVLTRDHEHKHVGHTLHTTNIVGSHHKYKDLSPFAPLDQVMRFGNMIVLKVGIDSFPSKSFTPYSPGIAVSRNSLAEPHRNNFQYINEPSFDNFFNNFEQPQEGVFKEPIQTNKLIIEQPIANQEPLQFANLMQTALDTLLTNDRNNEVEIGLGCPIHHKKKSVQDKENINDADIIQVCSCRFIKNNQKNKKEKK